MLNIYLYINNHPLLEEKAAEPYIKLFNKGNQRSSFLTKATRGVLNERAPPPSPLPPPSKREEEKNGKKIHATKIPMAAAPS